MLWASLFAFLMSSVPLLAQSKNIWVSAEELAQRPTSGVAWEWLLEAANAVDTLTVEGGHNSIHDTHTMAAALVAARLSDNAWKQVVADNIMKAVNQHVENDGNSLSLSRTIPGYVIAADLIDFRSFDPGREAAFRAWLEHVVYELRLDDVNQAEKHEIRGNNQGIQAGVTRIVSAIYLDNTEDLNRAAQIFKGWLGDTTAYAGFDWGDLCWQADPAHPVGILPQGSTMFVAGAIRDVDGVQPDDQRRAGCPETELNWPPRTDVHVWGGLAGAIAQAYLLSRVGFDTWNWQDQAILRAVSWQHDPNRGNAPAEDDDLWTLPLIDQFYGTDYWDGFPTKDGKQVGWTDWTHGGEKATQLSIQIEIEGQGTVELFPLGPSYRAGTQVQVTAVPADGWLFIGWDEDLEGIESTQSVVMDDVKEVTAIFGETASTVIVEPSVSTSPTPDDPNDITIWVHPSNPERSVLIGVDKDEGLYVWDMTGAELQHVPYDTSVNTIDVRQGIRLGEELVDLVVANLRDAGKLAVFKVNPDYTGSDVLVQIADIHSFNNDIQADSYGLSLYKRPSDGALFLFERPKRDGTLRQYRMEDDSTGTGVKVTPVRDLNYSGGKAEGLVTDDELGFLYVAEEGEGIHKFLADPTDSPDPIAFFAENDGITPTRQGLGLYKCNDGGGYLILSSKGNSTFKIYEREGNNRFVKTVVPTDDLGEIGLGSEGLDATSSAVLPNFPGGFVVAHDLATNKFHLFDWVRIAESDLHVCANGVVIPRPDITVSPSSHDFGTLPVGTTAEQTVTVTNAGNADLSVVSVALVDNADDEFAITSGGDSFVLTPAQSRQIVIAFNPVSVGQTNATVRLRSNDPDQEVVDIPLVGAGFVPKPQISVAPQSEHFGLVAIGRSEVRSFTVSNTGAADLNLTNVTIIGSHQSEFNLETTFTPFTLQPGESQSFSVNFSPETGGVKEASLRFESNDHNDNPFDVDLMGAASFEEPETVVLPPSDDTYIRSTRATNNYGDKNAMYVREAIGIFIGYIKFTVSDLISPVASAKLRVFTIDDGPDGGSIYQVSNNYQNSETPWNEMGLTWDNAPAIAGDPLDAVGEAPLDTWVEFDVSAAITGNGTFSFAIRNGDSEDVKYSSKEWIQPPELVIETEGGINPATHILKISGDNQTGSVGGTLAEPLVVEVRNDDDLPVAGVPVTFEILSGSGSLSGGQQQFTGNDGRVSTEWTLGQVPGENVVRVSSDGLQGSPLTFAATAEPLPASQLVKISGDNQSGFVDSTLSQPLVVEVRNAAGDPVEGVSVLFEVVTGGGSLSDNGPQLTDVAGRVSTFLTLGAEPGENSVRASSDGLSGSPILFEATALRLPAHELVKISGDQQSGRADSTLSEPLVVEVRNVAGQPVSGVTVTFEVILGNGVLGASQPQVTGLDGRASTTLTLGSAPGENRVRVSSEGLTGSPLVFTATASALPAARLVKISGDNQSALIDSTLPQPFIVEIQSEDEDPVSGVEVTFEVVSGGGALSTPQPQVTDQSGRAESILTVGSVAGVNNVKVSSEGLEGSPLFFTAVATDLPATQLVKISGDNQSTLVGSQLSEPLVVVVRNDRDEPVSGIPVTFEVTSGGGELLTAQPVISDAEGLAASSWVLGSDTGENVVTVSSSELEGAALTFSATATALPASKIVMISGNEQTGTVDSTLAQPFVVEVRNELDEPVSGVSVTFAVAAGGGILNGETTQVTATDGRASTYLTLGSSAGENLVTATSDGLSGSPVTFSATALTLPPTQIVKISGDGQTAFVDSSLSEPLVVEVRNIHGEPVRGVPVLFAVSAGGGRLTDGTERVTGEDGRASNRLVLGPAVGENQVLVSSSGLDGSPMQFTATAVRLPPAQLVKISGDNQSAFADSTLGDPFVVEVQNAAGQPVAGVSVTFEVISGGGTVTPTGPLSTDSTGQASAFFTLGSLPGENQVQVTSDGLEGSPLVFTATGFPQSAAGIIKVSGDGQIAFLDSTLAEPLVVEVRDAGGRPVSGVAVTFEVTSGGGTVSGVQPRTTGTDGRASSFLSVGGVPGINNVRVRSDGLAGSPLFFSAIARSLPPTTLVRISGDGQSGFVDSTLSQPFIVEVRNSAGETVSGVEVHFEVTSGGGSLAGGPIRTTDSAGRASNVLTLGSTPGEQLVTVSVNGLEGSPLTFVSTAVALPPTQLVKVSGDNQSAFVDSTLAEALVVEVRNAADEPVGGVSVAFEVQSGGGALSASEQVTDPSGRVSVNWTVGREPGENLVVVTSDGLNGSPLTFAATARPLPPSQLVKTGGDLQTAFVDSTLPQPLLVEVRNAAEQPVSDVPVAFEIRLGGGSLSAENPIRTDENGRASILWTLGAAPGENRLSVYSPQISGDSLFFSATANALPPTQLVEISGNNQTAFVDSTLPQPFVVEVRNRADEPVSGVAVGFDLISGDGILSNAQSQITDSNGRAETTLTLGNAVGQYSVQASSAGLTGSPIVFVATAEPLPAAELVKISGDHQSAFVNSTLSAPFVVEVRNLDGKPVSGTEVAFDILSGDGSLSNPQPQVTGADGRASTTLTLGEDPGENVVHARSEGLTGSPLVFTVTAEPLPPTQLVKVSGDGQVGFVDSTLSEPLVVEVLNAVGEPVAGVPLGFSVAAGDGHLSLSETVSDSSGRALTILTLGATPGENRIQVESPGLDGSPMIFTAQALELPIAEIVKVSGDDQSGLISTTLSEPFVVEVRDLAGKPVAGRLVTFTVISGGGHLSNLEQLTDSQGHASTVLTLGSTAGENRVEALAEGLESSPVTFVATASALPVTQLIAVSGDDQSGQVGTALIEPLLVRALNANNEPVAGAAVTFAVESGGGFLLNAQPQLTDVRGEAATVLVLGPNAGLNEVSAVVAGQSGQTVMFSAQGVETTAELTFHATHDTYIRSNKPRNEFGDKVTMFVTDASTIFTSFLKFEVDGADSPVRAAKIRLLVIGAGVHGGVIFPVSNTHRDSDDPWTEDELNWENAPPLGADGLDSLQAVEEESYVEFDVTPAIAGSGTYSFAIRGRAPDLVKYSSKEGWAAPELILTVGQAGGVSQLVQISGDLQTGIAGTALPEPLVVEARDTNGFPVSGVPVRFEVISGDGLLSSTEPQVTEANGRASVNLTLGPEAGENGVEARLEGGVLPGVVFAATALPRRFTATVNTEGNGRVDSNPPGPLHDEGDSVTLVAQPDSGWSFVGWSGDLSGTKNPVTIVMNSDKTVTATFSEIPPQQYSLALTQEGGGLVEVTPPGEQHVEGTFVSLTAVADSGWVFSGWSGDSVSATNPLRILMDSDKSLHATFTPNASPVAQEDQFTVREDESLAVSAPGVLENDSDGDGDDLAIALVTGPARGELVLDPDGSFTYRPHLNFSGADEFEYRIDDGKGASSTATARIAVLAVNDAPVAGDDRYAVEAEQPFSVVAPGVLENDSDVDSEQLTVAVLSSAVNGSVSLDSDGAFTYTPNPGFVGSDLFRYEVEDEHGARTTAQVFLTVNPNEIVYEETISGGSRESEVVTTETAVIGKEGHLYLVAIASKPFREVISVSGLGFSWTKVRQQCGARTQTGMQVWMAQGAASGDDVISATFVRAPKNATIAVSRYSGVDPLAPIGETVSSNTNGLDGSCSRGRDSESYHFEFATTVPKAFVYTAVAMRERAHSAGNGFTERVQRVHGSGGAGAGLAVQDRMVETTSTIDVEGSFTDHVDWAVVALELKPGAGVLEQDQFSLNLTTEGSGTVDVNPPGSTFSENSLVTLTATPESGWTFSGWGGDAQGAESLLTLVMNADKSVAATFTEIVPEEFTVEVTGDGPGTAALDPPGGLYTEDTEITLTANPDSGATFTGWSGDLSGLQNPRNILVDSDKEIVATFIRNQAPVVGNDTYDLDEDNTLNIAAPGVLTNDSDSDGDPMTSHLETAVTEGSVNLNADGSFTYTPRVNFNGVDSFTYRAVDSKGGSAVGVVTLQVRPTNDSPIAANDAYDVLEDDTLAISSPGILANDFDPDQDNLTVSLLTGPSNGTLELSPNGAFAYFPDEDFSGTDSFVYSVQDGKVADSSGVVSLNVSRVNDSPVARDDVFSITEDDSLLIPSETGLLANDFDPDGNVLLASVNEAPAHGSLVLNEDGSFTYVPDPDFNGPDVFGYTLTDDQGGTAAGLVTITVVAINDVPVAADDAFDLLVGETLNPVPPGVLGNDSDADGDALTAILMSDPSHGALVLNEDGSFTYTPEGGFIGVDSFTYGVSDSTGSAAVGTVDLRVNPDRIVHQQTVSGGSSDESIVRTTEALQAADGNLYLATISTKPHRSVTDVTGLGLSWTRVREQCAGRKQTGVQIWQAFGSPVADEEVTAHLASSPKNAAITVSRYSGVDASNPLGNVISGNTNGLDGRCSGGSDTENYAFDFATALDGATVFTAVAMRNKTHLPSGGFRIRAEEVRGTGGSGAGLMVQDTLIEVASAFEISGSFNSDVDWALIAVELLPPASLAKSASLSHQDGGDPQVDAIPKSFELGQNHPNPFNPTTTISFSLPKTTKASLLIYNIRGQLVRTLHQGPLNAGRHKIVWDGRNDRKDNVASGVYVYRLETDDFSDYKKMILAK